MNGKLAAWTQMVATAAQGLLNYIGGTWFRLSAAKRYDCSEWPSFWSLGSLC